MKIYEMIERKSWCAGNGCWRYHDAEPSAGFSGKDRGYLSGTEAGSLSFAGACKRPGKGVEVKPGAFKSGKCLV